MANEQVIKEVTPNFLRYILHNDCSRNQKDANPISAVEVVEAINQGKKVEIINAVIDGPFTLRSVTVESEISIQQSEFRGIIDCSYATFNEVVSLPPSSSPPEATLYPC